MTTELALKPAFSEWIERIPSGNKLPRGRMFSAENRLRKFKSRLAAWNGKEWIYRDNFGNWSGSTLQKHNH